LDIKTRLGSGSRRTGLMGKQYLCSGIGGRPKQCGRRVAELRGIKVMRAVISDAGEHQRCAVVLQDDVFILEYLHAETPNFIGPSALSGVVLMIAGDKEGAVACCQSG
jgi:hypothetical protein